jgi:probable aminopeptidase NPEPL1
LCGDLCFPLVFAPELHFSEFNSEVADMKNSVSKGDNAASACAGLFVHSHLAKNFEGVWIHLDIASPVLDGDRATGYGVALLNSLFADSSNNSLLKSIGPNSELPVKNDSNED